MREFYQITDEILKLYNLLEDKQSKDIFAARLQCDLDHNATNLIHLFSAGARLNTEQLLEQLAFSDRLNELLRAGEKVVIYGTGSAATGIGHCC